MKKVKNTKKESRQTQPLKWLEAKKALAHLQIGKDWAGLLILAVGFYSGYRLGDMLKLKFSDFKQQRLEITEQKTSKQRSIPIATELRSLVELCRINTKKDGSNFLFTNTRYNSNKPISIQAAITRIKTTLKKCGFVGQLSGHTLRKTFALRYYELMSDRNGEYRALSELAKQLNHSNTDVTRRYICIDKKEIESVFADFG